MPLLSPLPEANVNYVATRLECIMSTLHEGGGGGGGGKGRGGKMFYFDELLRWCPKSFYQSCRNQRR